MEGISLNKVSNRSNTSGESDKIIICVLFKSGKLAAAYYNKFENMLYVLNEITDSPPEFPAVRSILRELNPFHTITLGSRCDKFVKVLINILSGQYLQTSEDEHEVTIPNNMTLQTYEEYSFSSCENKIKMLRLLSEPPEIDDSQRELYLNSLINFQFQLSIHSLGTLLRFIEKSWISLTQEGESQPLFYHIYQLPLADRVFIDSTTFEGLQVFKEMNHDASFKRGTTSSSREGISLFRIFSKYCVSQVGINELRNIMLNPLKNKEELKKRLDFIEFVLKPSSHGFVETMRDIIKNISELNMVFQKIQNAKGSHNDWKTLFKTIHNTIFLSDSCKNYANDSRIMKDLTETVDEKLFGLEVCIDSAIDVNSTAWSIRPLIKTGLDANLDKVKRQRDQIVTHVKAAANVVVEQLPSYMKECALLYVPDAGHMVSIPKWEDNCDVHQLRDYGFHFMFELQGHLHYKNALCQELDKQLGDIQTEISNHENRIIERVTGFVLRYNQKIRDPIKVIALMDGLISMAKVASERRYCRPSYNDENVIEIVGGRHPILEIIEQNYVWNDYCSGEVYTKVKIITGPHTSGKSVYLKQTALLLYLAHIGSYLAATSANVTLLHSIHSRINSIETASLHLSAFTIDLTQMAQALHNAKSSSLVIMDEFGKGTTGHEGFALLMGALTNFLKRSSCPHVLVTSHFQVDQTFLNSPLIQYQKMEHIWDEKTNDIVFLYKVADGISKSYASEIADLIDLDRDITLRARNILDCYNNLLPIQPLASRLTQQCDIDNEFLTTFDIPEVDL